MRRIKEALSLSLDKGLNQTQVALALRLARSTVQDYLRRAEQAGLVRNPVHWIHRSVSIGSTLPGGLDPGFRSHWIHLGPFSWNGGSNGMESLDMT